jgi:hypothetical protein
MAELAVRDGYPPPGDLPRGDCVTTTLFGDDNRPAGLRVDHADPRVLISSELLDNIADRPADALSIGTQLDLATCHTYVGAVLKISGVNRTVVYRITEYVPAVHGYIAEWPD